MNYTQLENWITQHLIKGSNLSFGLFPKGLKLFTANWSAESQSNSRSSLTKPFEKGHQKPPKEKSIPTLLV